MNNNFWTRIDLFLCLNAFFVLNVFSQTSFEINFKNYVGNEILVLDSNTYKNEINQDFTVTKFKYYIGNIELTQQNGQVIQEKGYFLIDHDKPNTGKIIFDSIPFGTYISISFLIGVDSIFNCSGSQSGVLDPINGMFWTWNSGYIFMKLEGISESSLAPNGIVEYHIGGYLPPNNAIRKIHLNFSEPFEVSPIGKNILSIKTDVLEILKTPTTIDFSMLSSVTEMKNATVIADNYANMFSIIRLKNE